MGTNSSKANNVECELIFVTNPEDGHPILCKVWKPPAAAVRGAVFFIHGGMFSKGNLNSHPKVSQALALQLGFAVITASFRDGRDTPYSTGKTLADLKSVARYFRSQHASELPFGLVGSSSGGWFALATANAMEEGEVDFLIPLCPVSDPYERAVYLQHCTRRMFADHYHVRHEPDRAQVILDSQLQFFSTLETMQDAAKLLEVNKHNIPTLLIVGAADKNIPPSVTQHIQNAWATRTISIGGSGHEIQNIFPTDPSKDFVPDMDRFFQSVVMGKHNNPQSSAAQQQLTSCSSNRRLHPTVTILLVWAALLLLACALAALFYFWNLNDTQSQSFEHYWPSLEQGYLLVVKPLRLIMDFVQMVARGGAKSRSYHQENMTRRVLQQQANHYDARGGPLSFVFSS